MRGDRVEVVIDAGDDTRTYEIEATRAGRRVEITHGRGLVEVTETTRGGTKVRTARFMANRVLALVEHPASQDVLSDDAAVTHLRQPAWSVAQELVVMTGLQASGKSTWVAENLAATHAVVSK